MTLVGIVAGLGVDEMTERVIERILLADKVRHLWLATAGRAPRYLRDWDRLGIIEMPIPTYADLYAARNAMLDAMEAAKTDEDRWFHISDNDWLPAYDFYDVLEEMPDTDDPIMVGSKLYNYDNNRRYYDLAAFEGSNPVCPDYEDWLNPKWDKTRYINGTGHVHNRAGFALGTRYLAVRGEDPSYCWEFVKRGGRLTWNPLLRGQLAKPHGGIGIPSQCSS
jgi:hypothetical protein